MPVASKAVNHRSIGKTATLISSGVVTAQLLRISSRVPEIQRALELIPPFWKGMAISSVASAVVLSILSHKFQQTLVRHKDISKYPAHGKPTVHLRGPSRYEVPVGILDPHVYRSFPLVEKKQLSHNTYRFVLGLPQSTDVLGLPLGQHVIIRAEIDGKLITRSYTPTSSNADLGRMELTIKVYPRGKMGNYLLSLPLDAQVSIRGPSGRFRGYNRHMCSHVGCIAGGTGMLLPQVSP
jgi:cytochrome-b5 reductase